jgi:hypothetical protein
MKAETMGAIKELQERPFRRKVAIEIIDQSRARGAEIATANMKDKTDEGGVLRRVESLFRRSKKSA